MADCDNALTAIGARKPHGGRSEKYIITEEVKIVKHTLDTFVLFRQIHIFTKKHFFN